MAQRGVIRSAALTVAIIVPLYTAYAAPAVILGFGIRELTHQRWFTGAMLAGCAGLAYLVLRIAGRRFVSWADDRRQGEQH